MVKGDRRLHAMSASILSSTAPKRLAKSIKLTDLMRLKHHLATYAHHPLQQEHPQ